MVSIIMPTYNRAETARESIEKAMNIHCDITFEIIVVNDGEKLPFVINHPIVSILRNPGKGAASARNFGAENAKYSILFFIDDDMWVTGESLIAIKELENNAFLNTSCIVLNWQYPSSLIQEMTKNKIGRYLLNANYHKLEGRLGQKIDMKISMIRLQLIGSGSFVITKELFYKAGKYNEEFVFVGEDIDFSQKLQDVDVPLFLYSKITCYHNQKDRLNLNEFLNREHRGYLSLFNNKKLRQKPNRIKQIIYSILIPFNCIFLSLFNIIPNRPVFDIITFRIIGALNSIVYFKAWYTVS